MEHILFEAHEDDAINAIMAQLLSDSEDERDHTQRGGSKPGRSTNIERSQERLAEQLDEDYFAEQPTFTPDMFVCKFRIERLRYSAREGLYWPR